MTSGFDELPTVEPRPQGRPLIAWFVILLVAALVIGGQMFRARAVAIQPPPEAGESALVQSAFQLQARILVAAAELLGEEGSDPIRESVAQLQGDSPWQQVRVAILAGAVIGPKAALERLDALPDIEKGDDAVVDDDNNKLPNKADHAADETVTADVLRRLYHDYAHDKPDAPSVTDLELQQLEQQLGWFGQLAFAGSGQPSPQRAAALVAARETLESFLTGIAVFALLALLGLVVFAVLLYSLLRGTFSALQRSADLGGIYAEAFACWIVLYAGLNLFFRLLLGGDAIILGSLLASISSLLAVAWPLLRGVSWSQLRADIGWTLRGGPIRNVLIGLGGYPMALPLVLIGALFASALAQRDEDHGAAERLPVHPITQWIADATTAQQVQLVLLACVLAPLIEETMFRGFLYRHLRESTWNWGRWGSIGLSALTSSLLFAILHPQGLIGVPMLTAIALVLALLREWRDSLLPSMVMHAVNNGVAMLMLFFLLG